MIKYSILLIVLFSRGYSSPIKGEEAAPTCQACHPVDPDKINIHLIPHSHDDVGWLKTVDQYFYGSHSEIQRAGVQYIISSVVEALKADPDRRYAQVETAFFWKWWEHQTDSIKQDTINLVNNGQLEMANAAWSSNDEAATNYHSTIDQFTFGLRTISDTVGPCGAPRSSWQLDPFGHSREQASISAQLGFDGFFFGRLDFNDYNNRTAEKNMEVIWQGSANLDNVNIFTNMMPEGYGTPGGFCFDIECGDEVMVDDPSSPDYNIPRRVEDFENHVLQLANYYRTKNVLIPMGTDFRYQSAEKNFINMDKLIAGFQGHDQVNVIYSTPTCYIRAVNDMATANNVEFVVKTDDFFPYASGAHNYWTGYFTSRPNAKRFERTTHNVLQAAKQLASFSKVNGEDHEEDLVLMKQALGILQHHDSITGTAKQAVADDYARMLDKGIKRSEPALNAIVTNLLKKDASADINLNLQTCLLTNASICGVTDSDRFVVSLYNSLERSVNHYVRVPVLDGTYTVTGPDGDVNAELVDSISSFSYVYSDIGTPKPKELVFEATEIPGLGIKLYHIERTSTKSTAVKKVPALRFGTDDVGFEIDDQSGLLSSVTMNGQTVNIKQEFIYYEGYNGYNNGEDDAASGAYIFRPRTNETTVIATSVTVTSTTTDLVDEVRQEFNDWITQIIRVYKGTNKDYIEFDWLVGPIEVDNDNGIGREIVSRFTIDDFNNEGTFYTDSNGREMLKRTLNYRSDYEYDPSNEPVASNYYPVTSKIVIRDESKNLEIAVLNDRSQGGSSLENGVVELMVHRRLLRDDAKGVGEALDETEFGQGIVARGQHYLVIGPIESTPAKERVIALQKLLRPLELYGEASSLDDLQNSVNFIFEGLQGSLPENVHILTLEPWQEDTYVLRLEHIIERNEDANLSEDVTVNLQGLFTLFEITDIRETTLGANQYLDEFEAKEKYVWNAKGGKKIVNRNVALEAGDLNVPLTAMQIRTFIIQVSKNN